MDFNGLIPALQTGNIDVALAAMTIRSQAGGSGGLLIPLLRQRPDADGADREYRHQGPRGREGQGDRGQDRHHGGRLRGHPGSQGDQALQQHRRRLSRRPRGPGRRGHPRYAQYPVLREDRRRRQGQDHGPEPGRPELRHRLPTGQRTAREGEYRAPEDDGRRPLREYLRKMVRQRIEVLIPKNRKAASPERSLPFSPGCGTHRAACGGDGFVPAVNARRGITA